MNQPDPRPFMGPVIPRADPFELFMARVAGVKSLYEDDTYVIEFYKYKGIIFLSKMSRKH